MKIFGMNDVHVAGTIAPAIRAPLAQLAENIRRVPVQPGPIADLPGGAVLADVIAKVNEMLAAQRAGKLIQE